MFILTLISDLVRIPPDRFHIKTMNAVTHELNNKYCNKIIPHVGLGISVYDVLSIDEGQVKPGDGASFINVKFRILVFKPVVGEILTGWITKCSNDGIQISIGNFFNDVFIPSNMLFENCVYNPNDNAWIWSMDEETQLYFDVNEMIRFRVEKEVFIDIKPTDPSKETKNDEDEKDSANGAENENNKNPPPYALIGSCQTDGMGLVSWWE